MPDISAEYEPFMIMSLYTTQENVPSVFILTPAYLFRTGGIYYQKGDTNNE